MIELAYHSLGNAGAQSPTELAEFFRQRLITLFTQQGFRADELEAVLGDGMDSLVLTASKLQGLKSVRGRPGVRLVVCGVETRNLLTQAASKQTISDAISVAAEKLADDADRVLFNNPTELEPKLKDAASKADFTSALPHWLR